MCGNVLSGIFLRKFHKEAFRKPPNSDFSVCQGTPVPHQALSENRKLNVVETSGLSDRAHVWISLALGPECCP